MIRFHNGENIAGWFSSLNLEVRRMAILLDELCAELGYDLICTSIFRTEEHQRTICKKLEIPYKPSPHMFWNAADFVPSDGKSKRIVLPDNVADSICRIVNEKHPYGPGNSSCLWHKGTGWHFHLQANYRKHGNGRGEE